MFVIGAILIVLAIIVMIYVTFSTRSLEPLTIDWGPFTAALTPLQLFYLGAVTILVLAIGAVMFSIGLKSQGAKRAEVKQLRKEVKAAQTDTSGSNADSSTSRADRDADESSPESHDADRADARRDRSQSPSTSGDPTTTTTDGSKSSGPKLPPPVPPRDNTPPPRAGGR